MHYILPRLACGSLCDAQQIVRQSDASPSVDTILTLCEEKLPQHHGICMVYYPVPDDRPWSLAQIDHLLRFLRDQLWGGRRVLVHCHGGVTRSPALCAAYLLACGFAPDNAKAEVTEQRPEARGMHPVVWQSIVEWWRIQ